ncbi:hypothetical protein [Martelella endophytica]|nr:hypothetical protein [Martelella endophytica]
MTVELRRVLDGGFRGGFAASEIKNAAMMAAAALILSCPLPMSINAA